MPVSARVETIGDATLILGDCREVLPTLGKVDAVVTDPPYEFVPMGGGIGGRRQVYKDIYSEGLHEGFDPDLVLGLAPSITVFCAKAQMARMIEFATVNEFRWNLTTFNKTNPTPLCGANYLPDTEYVFHFWKGIRLGGEYRDKSRFWVGPASGDSAVHPTIKPVGLMEKLVRVATNAPDAVFLDPFMGSGTTGVACARLGRRFIGIEINEKHFATSCRRIEAAARQADLFVPAPEAPLKQGALL